MKKGARLSHKQGRNWRLILLIVLVVSLTVCTAVSTVAWLTAQDQVKNSLTPGSTCIEILEDFPAPYTEKSHVRVKNSGDISVYVRAAVSVYWQTEEGTVLAECPEENVDYEITWGASSLWKKQGSFYYYTVPLEPEAVTEELIAKCVQRTEHTEGKLVVDISTQSIQVDPSSVVQDTWKISADADGTLLLP